MFCDRCGTNLPEGAGFCPNCAKPVGATPLVPAHSRVAGHVRLLGIFWVALSAFRLIPGLALLMVFGRNPDFPPGVPYVVHGLLSGIGWLFLAAASIGLITGWGLLRREPWARTLAIIIALVSLLDMPFGTALGIYTLWVLLPAKAEQEFRDASRTV